MPDKKRHIVLITNWFPPKQGVAVARMLGFVRYLDHQKNTITVISEGSPSTEITPYGMVVTVEAKSHISKLGFKPGEHKFIHTSKVLWNVALSRMKGVIDRDWSSATCNQLEKIHAQHPIDVVISSYAPASTHLAAYLFCKSRPQIKWIADMRDEMSLNPHLSSHERKQLAKIEQLVDERADAVTTVSAPILDDFRRLMPNVKQFEEVRNGFDHRQQFDYHFNPVFTISYAGTFYGAIKPDTFFKGLQQFTEKNNVQVHLQFVGTHKNFNLPDVFKNNCTFIPRCSSAEALNHMAAADANLLLLPTIGRKGVYSGKIFEYISVGKPLIAAIDPNDVAAVLIRETQSGFIAAFDRPESIAEAIASAYTLWKERKTMPSIKVKVAELHRSYQVQRLEKLIDQLTGI